MKRKQPDYLPDLPLYCYPTDFAEITGIDAREIRTMCKRQEIPNEHLRNGRFRINTYEALKVLRERAESFRGHDEPPEPVLIEKKSNELQPDCYKKYLDRLRKKSRQAG
ncbi:hypothetical protein KL86SPO_50147 [uncultured Sporomusa sp.]|uniref:Helix-turn-helix domain-containing protein n=1 Tax=uncultured Sporomusa sp. TaxID=307249 RepID=A0A212LXZ4_9FIRM|nr:hypothetical protein [uncultured Sporomusa sp.]SCM82376.1 hypothetical protein KL86SPO_50147 [uncultured Sporomusa sp.]